MRTLSIVIVLLLTGLVSAEVSVTGDTKIATYTIGTLKAKGEPKTSFLWRADKKLSVVKKGAELYYTGAPGTYDILLIGFSIKDGAAVVEEAEVTVTIGNNPNPPNPPDPPTPPNPDDPWTKAVRADYLAETAADKHVALTTLIGIYKYAVKLSADSQYSTTGELIGAVRTSSKAWLGDDYLTKVRKGAIQKYMKDNLPDDLTLNLTDDLRKKYATVWGKIASTLEAIAKEQS